MSSMTATGDYPLLNEYYGQVVPRSVEAGFVALSYVVSLIGAGATLELINRRTSPKGLYNHMLLVGAAITMGGISIWCMVSLTLLPHWLIHFTMYRARILIDAISISSATGPSGWEMEP